MRRFSRVCVCENILTVTEVAFLKFPFKVELFTAKDLVGTKLIGNPNAYTVITCGNENRFRFVRLVSHFLHLNFSPRNDGALVSS